MAEDSLVEKEVLKVCIAIPNNGYTQVESYENRLVNFLYLGKLEERMKYEGIKPRFEFYFMCIGRLYTPLAREQAVIHSIEQGMDYLFMIDDDMICPNDLFEKLYRHKVDVCGALAFTRNPPFKPVIYSAVEGWDTVARSSYFINNVVMNYPKDALVECDAIGFGCVLIDMKVFKKMKKPWFAYSSSTGEDITFCYAAKRNGFRVYVDTSAKVGHLGNPLKITEEFAEKFWETHGTGNKMVGEYNKYEVKKLA